MLGMLNRVQAIQRKAEQWRSAREEPQDVIEHVTPEPPTLEAYYRARYPKYDFAAHIKLALEFLASLEGGDIAILNFPPRHGKSDVVQAFIEHVLGVDPVSEIMYLSYSSSLAFQRSRSMRNQIRSGTAFRTAFPDVVLAHDAKKVVEWRLVQGGGLIASGIGGSLTGKGARIAVIDDPLKGRKSAESQVQRDAVIEAFKSDVFTRLDPNGIVIVIQTRWHLEDLTGWLESEIGNADGELGVDASRVKRLVLPALAEPSENTPDPLERAPGVALWPARWGERKLERAAKILGEYDFASLYQQRPFLRGGNLFHEPARYSRIGLTHFDWLQGFTPFTITITCDLAASKNRTADYTVFQVWAHQPALNALGRRARVLEVKRGHWSITEILAVAYELQQKYGVVIRVESVRSQIAVVNHLEENGVWLERIHPSSMGDKYARALQPAAAWNAGVIEVPLEADWDVPGYLREHMAFTGNGEGKDDQVDTTAYNWIFGGETQTVESIPSAGMTTARTSTSSFYRPVRG